MKQISKKMGDYIFVAPSRRPMKKYDVYRAKDSKYITSFGSSIHQQYKDKIGYYKKNNHLDKQRRKNYYNRFGKRAKFESAKFFSHKYLW